MTGAQPAPDEPATLVGLLDGLLDGGVHVAGDLVIGLADVELIRVALRLLVASEDTARRTGIAGPTDRPAATTAGARQPRGSHARGIPSQSDSAGARRSRLPGQLPPQRAAPLASTDPSSVDAADRERLIQGVSQLVLTVVELIRDLIERQAIRRVEAGSLTDDQVERLGVALQALEERMEEVKEVFGVGDEDLNLDLGPLGKLR